MSLGGNGKHEEGHRRAGGFRGGLCVDPTLLLCSPRGSNCLAGTAVLEGVIPLSPALYQHSCPRALPEPPPAPIQRTVFHRCVQAQPYLKECENG